MILSNDQLSLLVWSWCRDCRRVVVAGCKGKGRLIFISVPALNNGVVRISPGNRLDFAIRFTAYSICLPNEEGGTKARFLKQTYLETRALFELLPKGGVEIGQPLYVGSNEQ